MAGETILVVEDTELLRRIYQDKLAQEGYKVLAAADGLECLSMLRSQHVDLVLLDLVMPRMSGLEALEAMKADPRTAKTPVIVLSNLGQEGDVERGLSLGAFDYLVKTETKPTDVSIKIRRALAWSAAEEPPAVAGYHLIIRDHEADADRFVREQRLPRRFWCPACQTELVLELVPKADRPGWFDAHFVCAQCGRDFPS